jgi:hypothetical protein
MGLPMSVCCVFHYIVTTKTLDYIVETITLGIIVVFVIPFVVVLTSSPVMWHKEHLWNFNVLQRVHVSSVLSFRRR